ncbi:MAG: hypothetical protein NVS2B3_11940 [Vulcanimicrobiaceae bacterium]
MQNVPLLGLAARAGLPILLERGPAATLDELLLAAEYILVEGNERVVLCERGIRSFDPQTRNACELGGALRLQGPTHLPIVLDPSHASGRRSLIEPLALADKPFARSAARVRVVRAALASVAGEGDRPIVCEDLSQLAGARSLIGAPA